RSIQQKFSNIKKTYFQSMPYLSDNKLLDQLKIDLWHPRDFLPQNFVSHETFTAEFSNVAFIDSNKCLNQSFSDNQQWVLRTKKPIVNNGQLRSRYSYVTLHKSFWTTLFSQSILKTLYDEHIQPTQPITTIKQDIASALILLLNTNRGDMIQSGLIRFFSLPRLKEDGSICNESIKLLWHQHPIVRFELLKLTITNEIPRLMGAFLENDWCDCRDIDFSDEQLIELDKLLSNNTNHFEDTHACQSFKLIFCIIYWISLKQGHLSLESPHVVDKVLFKDDDFFSTWQIFTENHSLTTRFAVVCSDNAKRLIQQKVSSIGSMGTEWYLYGAGHLSRYILDSVSNDDLPSAILSNNINEQDQTLRGIKIISCDQIDSDTKATILVATRQRLYKNIIPDLYKKFPNSQLLPFFSHDHEPLTQLTTSSYTKCLLDSFYNNQFNLNWYQNNDIKKSYSMQDLVYWGQAIIENMKRLHPTHQIQSGDIFPILLKTSPAVYAIVYYCLLNGIIPTILSYPTERSSKTMYRKQIRSVTDNLSATLLITDEQLSESMISSGTEIFRLKDCYTPTFPQNRDLSHIEMSSGQEIALIQHSSGTTGLQKTIALEHAQVMAQINAYGQALQFSNTDKIASWLPLYHDMGLITSLIGPPCWGIPVSACDPISWVNTPALILNMISNEQVTHTWWPNFTFAFLAKRVLDHQ
ncbi:MAG: AMP-binding protein, partial [Methylococcales bacterium]|nr:AMP-binding protein [Methylococcales bacterium]